MPKLLSYCFLTLFLPCALGLDPLIEENETSRVPLTQLSKAPWIQVTQHQVIEPPFSKFMDFMAYANQYTDYIHMFPQIGRSLVRGQTELSTRMRLSDGTFINTGECICRWFERSLKQENAQRFHMILIELVAKMNQKEFLTFQRNRDAQRGTQIDQQKAQKNLLEAFEIIIFSDSNSYGTAALKLGAAYEYGYNPARQLYEALTEDFSNHYSVSNSYPKLYGVLQELHTTESSDYKCLFSFIMGELMAKGYVLTWDGDQLINHYKDAYRLAPTLGITYGDHLLKRIALIATRKLASWEFIAMNSEFEDFHRRLLEKKQVKFANSLGVLWGKSKIPQPKQCAIS